MGKNTFRKKTIYIPMWFCDDIGSCELEKNGGKTCLMCSHNVAYIESKKFEPWMQQYINDGIFLSKRAAEEYVKKIDEKNKRGGALLNVR